MSDALFRCSQAPDVPTDAELTAEDGDKRLSVYIAQLDLAHIDCEDQLGAVRNHLEVNGVTVTDTRPEAPEPERRGIWPF